jgi:hypothetical protein
MVSNMARKDAARHQLGVGIPANAAATDSVI